MPGAVQGRVIAIDPATYADAVTWSDQFGLGVDEVLAALAEPSDESIPVIAIEGEPVPSEGAFGLTRSYPYRVVCHGSRVPDSWRPQGQPAHVGRCDRGVRRRVGQRGSPPAVGGLSDTAVSQASAAALTESLDDAGVRYRDVVSQLEQRQSPSIVATRSAFGFLGAIGITAAAAACVALGLFLSARRRSRALTGVITRSMGLSAPRAAMISAFELGSLLLVSVVAGFVAAPLVVSRLVAAIRSGTRDDLRRWMCSSTGLPLVGGALIGVFVGSLDWCGCRSGTRVGGRPARWCAMATDAVLWCDQLVKFYETSTGRVQAVRGIDLEFAVGTTAAIVGPSGLGEVVAVANARRARPADGRDGHGRRRRSVAAL